MSSITPLKIEVELLNKNTKHGHSTSIKISQTYKSWDAMRQRCNNKNNPKYNIYGGRGITVCEQWKQFINFLNDMGEAPKGYQIDRINNDKGYYKRNCRWRTPKQQARNRSNNRLITHDGKTQCLSEWAEETGINRETISSRIKRGLSIKESLTTMVVKKHKTMSGGNQ